MEGFITFVFIFILIVWAISRVVPLLLAWWLRRKFRDIAAGQQHYHKNTTASEGDVIIDEEKREPKVVDKNVGEYIDFEETN
ncbi:MAG: hypothetical protein CVU12_01230 [Bacteroidetes bacterium HGW-Bacteroidetes-7]|jgi:hypothetical protein|nr:MAG: hypothetical protein CVU12_01230 [Bacteroidetes bacterium HGW-Bacteroidetes-7]